MSFKAILSNTFWISVILSDISFTSDEKGNQNLDLQHIFLFLLEHTCRSDRKYYITMLLYTCTCIIHSTILFLLLSFQDDDEPDPFSPPEPPPAEEEPEDDDQEEEEEEEKSADTGPLPTVLDREPPELPPELPQEDEEDTSKKTKTKKEDIR